MNLPHPHEEIEDYQRYHDDSAQRLRMAYRHSRDAVKNELQRRIKITEESLKEFGPVEPIEPTPKPNIVYGETD